MRINQKCFWSFCFVFFEEEEEAGAGRIEGSTSSQINSD
jgi:hypothetical protein